MAILDDSEFRTDYPIEPANPSAFPNETQEIFVFSHSREGIEYSVENKHFGYINVEFVQRADKDERTSIADLYFHPEDLERLGVLLQYEAKKYMQLREEVTAAKLKEEQNAQTQPRKGSILR